MGCEHPDWLPVGWRVSVKVRSCGRKDKYYVNPSNGLKFNSKPEVLRYLKYSAKGRKPRALNNKVEIRKTVADKLPPGWIKEIRTTKKGRKTRRDPYYIDPVTGRYFRSMQEVFRYLESKDSGKAEFKLDSKGHINQELGDHPQSSTAEAKRQRSMDKTAEKNLSGHESIKSGLKLAAALKPAATNSMSKPEEDNHLERKEEDDSLAIELSDKLQLVYRVKQHADRMAGIKKLADNKVDKRADGDRRFKSGSVGGAEKKVDMPEANVTKQLKRNFDSAAGSLPNTLPLVNRKEDLKYGRRQSKRLADSKLKDNISKDQSVESGSEGAGKKNVDTPVTNGFERKEKEKGTMGEEQEHESLLCQNKRKNTNSKWTSDLPRRASKRLACVEVDPSLEVKTSDKAGAEAALSCEPEVNTSKSVVKAGQSDEPDIDTIGKFDRCNNPKELPSKCKTENPTDNEQKEPVVQRNLSSLKDHKDVGVDCKEENKDEKHLDSSLKDLLMDPCIEFAVKTLTGAIPIEDMDKLGESPVSSLASPNQTSSSSSMLPSGDIWADPCFEFAVKMLTSETPAEDGTQWRVSFQQPLGSSGVGGCNSLTAPEFRLDNVYPSVYSSVGQPNAVKKPYMRQQGMRDCPPPHGGSQNFVGLRNGVEGRKQNFM
ncbi:methyl-CpG-binding domain-containing protein 13 isoform X1 [Sesamum indicum]|uniref:Methyl-CpG-binding domain-containing protein 13 isoform X1 n=2 Tax=Sesamum indicum TaxID=4182 RepID=A0A8M8URD1_SESIN|nr:methyl-CpG-binding domain-containing protein 13 isoform X1 [Sesamum indicum]